jgi:hypothetical protein
MKKKLFRTLAIIFAVEIFLAAIPASGKMYAVIPLTP